MNNKHRKLQEYMALPYTTILKRDDEGDIIARIKELEGCVAHGQDEMEAIGNLILVKEMWFEAALDAAQSIPLPEEETALPSGKFLVRIPRTLHKSLIDIAACEEVSLNQFATVALARAVERKEAVATHLDQVHASAPEYLQSRAYGSTQFISKLKLVNATSSGLQPLVNNDWPSETTLAGILSMSISVPTRKKA